MKRILAVLIVLSVFNTKSFSQEVVKPQKNTNKVIGKSYLNNEDSTLAKTSNGFDVKKSKIDNMVYLNANGNNLALNKMPIAINNLPVEPMPVSKPTKRNEYFKKDTSLSINITSDSLRRWKRN